MASDYNTIEAELGKRDYFPNTSSIAYFDPQSQTIHINRISRAAFQDALDRRDLSTLRQHLGTIMHEVTHWADLVGTTFGREYLCNVYELLRLLPGVNTPGRENEFHHFIEFHDLTRRFMMSRYYRIVNPQSRPHDMRKPWGIQLSAGYEFDRNGRQDRGRPILFTRFSDNSSGELIARQPIVVGALLEVNAMWSEMRTTFEAIGAISQPERTVEEAIYETELRSYIYNPDLTLYTAPAHLLAYFAQITEVFTAYELASTVAHLALNLSSDDFSKLILPQQMQPWTALLDGFKRPQDRGFAYTVICASGSPWQGGQAIKDWVDDALKKAGLGSSSDILSTALASARAASVADVESPLGRAERYLLSLGEKVMEIRSAGDTALTANRILRERLAVPPMFDSNGELFTVAAANFDIAQFSPEQMHAAAARLHTWTQNFLSACR